MLHERTEMGDMRIGPLPSQEQEGDEQARPQGGGEARIWPMGKARPLSWPQDLCQPCVVRCSVSFKRSCISPLCNGSGKWGALQRGSLMQYN